MVDQKHVLADKFRNPSWIAHLAYLADMFEYVNSEYIEQRIAKQKHQYYFD